MIQRVLFISEKKSMIANALIDGMNAAFFDVMQVKANVTEISRIENPPDVWILYLHGTENPLTDVLSYIRDQIDELNYRFFVIGTPEELEEVLKDFPPKCIKATFARPFRADDVIDRITMELEVVQKLSESKRILVIDDDATMLRTLKDLLSNRYRVYTANSGMNAIQMLVNTEVDLILLDYEMPVIKGPQILEMLRSEPHTQNIPVMFLTSKNDRESIIRVMSLSPANYLLKSLSRSEILEKIGDFFEEQDRQK